MNAWWAIAIASGPPALALRIEFGTVHGRTTASGLRGHSRGGGKDEFSDPFGLLNERSMPGAWDGHEGYVRA